MQIRRQPHPPCRGSPGTAPWVEGRPQVTPGLTRWHRFRSPYKAACIEITKEEKMMGKKIFSLEVPVYLDNPCI